jgi:hypothetical protein
MHDQSPNEAPTIGSETDSAVVVPESSSTLAPTSLISDELKEQTELTHVPQNVPQRHANQALHARYAAHARTFFLSEFVSIGNKGSKIYFPKLVVRVRFPSPAPVFPSNS